MISMIKLCATTLTVLLVVCSYSVVESVRYQVSPHPDYVATWEIANGTIDFVASVRTTGWVGLAVNYVPKMAGADIMFGGVDYYGGRGNYIYNYGAAGNTLSPKPYSYWTQGSVPFSEADGVTTVSFRRPLDTPEPNGVDIINTDMYFCWAIGRDDDTTMKHRANGATRINLLSPNTQSEPQQQLPAAVSPPETRSYNPYSPSPYYSYY